MIRAPYNNFEESFHSINANFREGTGYSQTYSRIFILIKLSSYFFTVLLYEYLDFVLSLA